MKEYKFNEIDLAWMKTRIIDQAKKEQLNFDLDYITAGALIGLHEEFGFGEKRLKRVARRMSQDFQLAAEKKKATLKDYKERLDKLGIEYATKVEVE